MKKFWFAFRPKSLDDGSANQYPLLVFDPHDQPFRPLTEFYRNEVNRISHTSALSYLYSLLPFFDWIMTSSNFQGNIVKWDASSEAIRTVIKQFIIECGFCRIQSHQDGFQLIRLSGKSPSTVRCFLSALRSFYTTMIQLGFYVHSNPMVDEKLLSTLLVEKHQQGTRRDLPRMPDVAGVFGNLKVPNFAAIIFYQYAARSNFYA